MTPAHACGAPGQSGYRPRLVISTHLGDAASVIGMEACAAPNSPWAGGGGRGV